MKTTYCNPLDLSYRYSHMNEGKRLAHREGADPTLIFFLLIIISRLLSRVIIERLSQFNWIILHKIEVCVVIDADLN